MARAAPKTIEALLAITGVGQKKAEQYGQVFLEAIAKESGFGLSVEEE
jgi:superfamily II DNA helicase RecQ